MARDIKITLAIFSCGIVAGLMIYHMIPMSRDVRPQSAAAEVGVHAPIEAKPAHPIVIARPAEPPKQTYTKYAIATWEEGRDPVWLIVRVGKDRYEERIIPDAYTDHWQDREEGETVQLPETWEHWSDDVSRGCRVMKDGKPHWVSNEEMGKRQYPTLIEGKVASIMSLDYKDEPKRDLTYATYFLHKD